MDFIGHLVLFTALKNFENLLRCDDVTAKVAPFWEHCV